MLYFMKFVVLPSVILLAACGWTPDSKDDVYAEEQIAVAETAVKDGQSSSDYAYPEMVAKMEKYMAELEDLHPDAMKSIYSLWEAVFVPGALDTKTKQLICLGISVAIRCDDCIAWHTRGLLQAGATKEEIIEVLGVAIVMGAGPSVAHATHVMEAMEQFKEIEK